MDSKTVEAAKTIHDFTTMTTRCYCKGKRTILYATEDFNEEEVDLFRPYYPELKRFKSPVGCITTPNDFYFGFINFCDEYLILGPVTDELKQDKILSNIAARIDPSGKNHDIIVRSLENSPKISVYSLLSMLTSTYKLMAFQGDSAITSRNGDLYSSVVDVTFYDSLSNKTSLRQVSMESVFEGIIESGDVKAMRGWFKNNPIFHFSIDITGDALRDARACFILCTSLYAKAANKGGLDRSYSLQIQLNAIRAMERMTDISDILLLQSNIAMEYTREVSLVKARPTNTKLIKDAISIIQRNLYGTIKVEEIANELFVSRGHLSKAFHREMGVTISTFIIDQKINEAKRLLRYSDQSLSQISATLKFSSQSHFTKAFKANTGQTPKQFRNESTSLISDEIE